MQRLDRELDALHSFTRRSSALRMPTRHEMSRDSALTHRREHVRQFSVRILTVTATDDQPGGDIRTLRIILGLSAGRSKMLVPQGFDVDEGYP